MHSDVTGALALAAGVVLIALGLWIPWRHRGEGAQTARRRWINRAIALLGSFVILYAGLYPTALAVVPTHKYRERIPAAPTGYESASSTAGWLAALGSVRAVPQWCGRRARPRWRRRRTGPLDHAELLRRHGYGVLLYDSRGRGKSDGTPNAWGWGWDRDVKGALDFLDARRDVDDGRIGGLGLSTGADVLSTLRRCTEPYELS